jgi:uncharacterized protein YndB with AHSA1/START domain
MTVTDVRKDPGSRTLTIEAEFDASPERIWELWADPRQLERWWGPPTYPATFETHDLRPGGHVTYYMIGPEGDQPRGFWRWTRSSPRIDWSSATASRTRTVRRTPSSR